MPDKCNKCCSRLFCMSVAETNEEDFESYANRKVCKTVTFHGEDYYVLRNTDTGMYFRGKGVNRWGKYFNQATIYRIKGTALSSMRDIALRGEKAELVKIRITEVD